MADAKVIQNDPHAAAPGEELDINRENMTRADWHELFMALDDQAREGRIAAVVIMLADPRLPDQAIVESYGKAEMREIASRKTIESIIESEAGRQPQLALAIAKGLDSLRRKVH